MSAEAVVEALRALEDPDLRSRLAAGDADVLAQFSLTAEEIALLSEAAQLEPEVTGYGFVEGVLVAVLSLGGGGAAFTASGSSVGVPMQERVELVRTAPETPAPLPSAEGLTLTAADALVTPPASQPATAAHYEVTTLSATFIDASRSTPARGSVPGAPDRTLATTVYTPNGEGPFPLVVFVHGYNSSAATYDALLREVAAGGFIVAAPDFPVTSTALDGPVGARDIVEQAADVSFVITGVVDLGSRPGALAGLVADGPVAVMGHSDGGVTAAGVAFADRVADARVGAAVILSGARGWFSGPWFDQQSPPLLAVHGTADEVNPLASSEQLVAGAAGEKHLVSVDGGSHIGPFTTDESRSAVSHLIVDFLHGSLSRDERAAAAFAADATASGLHEMPS